jgi:signal transduction histidine kinase
MNQQLLSQPISQDTALGNLLDADGSINLEKLLKAWDAATVRLQDTHETLRLEVTRLSDELENKNKEIARKNRLADLGQMASHIAHEVRNSLTPLTLYVSLLGRKLQDDTENRTIVRKIDSGLTMLDSTVNDLLHFTSDRQPATGRFDLFSLLQEIREELEPQLEAQSVDVIVDTNPATMIKADRQMVRRSIANLILNGLDVMPSGGRIVVTSYETASAVEIEVADSGPGFSKEVAARMFDPFFTTKNTGTGLGLAIVQRVAEVHDGWLTAINCPEGGAAITLALPKYTMEAAA